MFNHVWDHDVCLKLGRQPVEAIKAIDPNADYRVIVVFDQYAIELTPDTTWGTPRSVWPVWRYGDSISDLEGMLENPIGDEPDPPDWEHLPVNGQEHRVIIAGLPKIDSGAGRTVLRALVAAQDDHPDALMHLHGVESFNVLFGMNFRTAEFDAYCNVKDPGIVIPAGKTLQLNKIPKFVQWVTLLGYVPSDLNHLENRVRYNVRSARWAAEHYRENFRFKATGRGLATEPDGDTEVGRAYRGERTRVQEGDKLLCDLCSIQHRCKYFRSGEVCSIPGTEPARLAAMFKSRDSQTIIEGLSTLVASGVERLERAMEDESDFGGPGDGVLDPEVTRLANSVFDRGVVLAKLIDPTLRTGPGRPVQVGVQVNTGSPAQQVEQGTTQALVAGIAAQLEAQGIPRERQTPEMFEMVLNGQAPVIDIPALVSGEE